jgi:uncharacterized membrane protein HdeD (DUF308 family)
MSAASMNSSQREMTPWWLVLLEGTAMLIVGILLLIKPGMTTLVFVQFVGIYWLISGIFQIIGIFLDRSLWGWKLFAGILGILAGIIVVRHPIWSPVVLTSTLIIILGILGVIYGGIGLYQAFKGAGWGAGILGALSIFFGIYFLANIGQAALVLPWVIGVLAVVGGIAVIVLAFRLK